MKTVLIVVLALMGTSVLVTGSCPNVETFPNNIIPACNNDLRIKLPNYDNATTYYSCLSGTPVLTPCPESPNGYFTYVLQTCTTCASYLAPVPCDYLSIDIACTETANTTTTCAPGTTASDNSTTVSNSTSTDASTTTTVASTTVASTTVTSTTVASTTVASTTEDSTTTTEVDSPSSDSFINGPGDASSTSGPTAPTAPTYTEGSTSDSNLMPPLVD